MNVIQFNYNDSTLIEKLVEFFIYYTKKNKNFSNKTEENNLKRRIQKMLTKCSLNNTFVVKKIEIIDCILETVSNNTLLNLSKLNRQWRLKCRENVNKRNLEIITRYGLSIFSKGIAITLLQYSGPGTELILKKNGTEIRSQCSKGKCVFYNIDQANVDQMLRDISIRWKFSSIGKKGPILKAFGCDEKYCIDSTNLDVRKWLSICCKFMIVATKI